MVIAMKHFFCSLILLIGLPLALEAQQWERIGLPGGTVSHLLCDSVAQKLYFISSNSILYKSSDFGVTAQRFPPPPGRLFLPPATCERPGKGLD